MSEIEIAVIKSNLETIKEDIGELKANYSRMADLLSKIVVYEDKFKANDESHRIMWDKLNKVCDTVTEYNTIIESLKRWQQIRDKLMVALITTAMAQLFSIVYFLLTRRG